MEHYLGKTPILTSLGIQKKLSKHNLKASLRKNSCAFFFFFFFCFKIVLKIGKHTVSNRWAFLSNVFMPFSSGKYRTNNAKTKQHWNIYACAKDRVTQTTDANVGKGATVRVNIEKEGASGVKS